MGAISCLSRAMETPLSLVMATSKVANGEIDYVVERYGSATYLARVANKKGTAAAGTSLCRFPWTALAKAYIELVERTAVLKALHNIPRDVCLWSSSLGFQEFSLREGEAGAV